MSNNDLENLLENPPESNRVDTFAPDEIISCGKCSRNNPPNRLACLYCGAELKPGLLNTDKFPLNFRKPELWEKGFNVVISGIEGEPKPTEMERSFSIDPALLNSASGGVYVPVMRTENAIQAEVASETARRLGYAATVVPDGSLNIVIRPLRVRAIEFFDDHIEFIDFNTGSRNSIDPAEIILIVPGFIFKESSESLEKRKRKKSEALEQFEMSHDEPVLDIYTSVDQIGFRVTNAGFDYSCLDEKKTSLASRNFVTLVEKLRERAPRARYVDAYRKLRRPLTDVWGLESSVSTDLIGVRVSKRSKTVTTNNLQQFTKFSRLQRIAYEKQARQ